MQSFIISSIASIVAIILSALILYIEKTYHFIKIPNDIYFMDYLAIEISFFSFIIYPLSAILINSLFICVPLKRIFNIELSESLRYE